MRDANRALRKGAIVLIAGSGFGLLGGCTLWGGTGDGTAPGDSGITRQELFERHPELVGDVWCYETIGTPVCYREPLPDAEGRLISAPLPRVEPAD